MMFVDFRVTSGDAKRVVRVGQCQNMGVMCREAVTRFLGMVSNSEYLGIIIIVSNACLQDDVVFSTRKVLDALGVSYSNEVFEGLGEEAKRMLGVLESEPTWRDDL